MTDTVLGPLANIGPLLYPKLETNSFQVPAAERAIAEKAQGFVSPNTGVRYAYNLPVPLRRVRLEIKSPLTISVAAASDFGSYELCTLPDTNMIFAGCEVDLAIVKAGTTNGIVAATDLDVGVGTAAASASTLATTMINILPKQDVDTDSLSVTLKAHSLAATPVFTGVLDGASNKLYLNVAAVITANDSLTFEGTIDLFYWDVGNLTS